MLSHERVRRGIVVVWISGEQVLEFSVECVILLTMASKSNADVFLD